ncbi:MAG: hypothetical protein L0J41_07110 [Alkalibacterium sp.]|uniref:Uncharacterized protein n=1 Tax=Alkalibacterium gilvum TaxID=1130080 RepID=A0A1H6S2D4_9LACT|nr:MULTISPECIES: hypothetical protein [Alkalibacterium]MDN6294477.1 hypothetical protein [Alkalibacterium sp.]MDN6296128.1 hypothetical protein [Alkalibacterium sp.]SEI62318.1 hypothetical protein SAMN04488113_1067 [Alkalibacterium gilvum]
MKNDYSKIAKRISIISIVVIIIGYFLWTILFPIQDINTLTDAELLATQKQFALNYSLGRFLLYLGFTGVIGSSLYLFMKAIQKRIMPNR